MKYMNRLSGVTPLAIALSLALVGACSGSGDSTKAPATETAAAVPVHGEESSLPGRLSISSATASSGSETATFAFDHDPRKAWNSGAFAPGWIQLDLGQPKTVTRVRLYTAQTPDGPTTHQILGGVTPDGLELLGTLEGTTVGGQWLELQVKGDVRYVKIASVKSPSWVAWGEIEIYE
jgi:hypothetical protein